MSNGLLRRLLANNGGAAAAEMALVTPLLLLIMAGGLEVGNYFMDEHRLVKAVRDGARFAARKDFTYFQACNAAPVDTVAPIENVVADTQTLIRTSYLSGGTDQLSNWSGGTISVTTRCSTGDGTTTYGGIYKDMANGARKVEISASVNYLPVLAPFGFSLMGAKLNAKQEAAVSGV
jgi:Flp pilus assembly protein TadG